jgi:tetratricopeptide (TPR) repeat protein
MRPRESMQVASHHKTVLGGVLLIGLLLALAAGCSSLPFSKKVTDSLGESELKKRNREITRHFDQQRDLAEFEAAKTRWTQQRDAKGCRESLEKILARSPQHRDARLLMVELSLAEDEPDLANRHAKAALDAFPNDAVMQYTMALTLDAQGKTSDAIAYYERAMKMDPRNETFAAAYQTAREALREERGHRQASQRGNANVAADMTDECVPTGYQEPAGPTLTAKDAGARRADSAGYAEGSQNTPTNDQLRRGYAALANHSPQSAMDCFHQAIDSNPDDPQIPIMAATAMLRVNEPGMAIELLKPAAKRFPNSAAVHRTLGVSYYRSGDYQSSEVALQQALSLDKSNALSYLLMGCTLAKLGQREAAEANFRQARALDPRYQTLR